MSKFINAISYSVIKMFLTSIHKKKEMIKTSDKCDSLKCIRLLTVLFITYITRWHTRRARMRNVVRSFFEFSIIEKGMVREKLINVSTVGHRTFFSKRYF
jgi:hypothetical protein